jgi:transcriptional regulator with XRE-family HTH domain
MVEKTRMEEIMHFGEKLSILLKQKRMTQRALADELEVNVQAINRYVKSSRQPRLDFIKKVAKCLAVPVSYFVNDYAEVAVDKDENKITDYTRLRVIGHVPANMDVDDIGDYMDEIYIHKRFLKNQKLVYVLRANNRDMAPVIEEEDYIVVCEMPQYKDNDTVVIRNRKTGELCIRVYVKADNSVVFVAKSPYLEAIVVNYKELIADLAEYYIVGKVTYQVRMHD